jgi:hypothetical protein
LRHKTNRKNAAEAWPRPIGDFVVNDGARAVRADRAAAPRGVENQEEISTSPVRCPAVRSVLLKLIFSLLHCRCSNRIAEL